MENRTTPDPSSKPAQTPDAGGSDATAYKMIRVLAWVLLVVLAGFLTAGVLQEAGILQNDNPFPWLKVLAIAAGMGTMAVKILRTQPPRP